MKNCEVQFWNFMNSGTVLLYFPFIIPDTSENLLTKLTYIVFQSEESVKTQDTRMLTAMY